MKSLSRRRGIDGRKSLRLMWARQTEGETHGNAIGTDVACVCTTMSRERLPDN